MQKYKYVRVTVDDPYVVTTDPSILDWIYSEVKKHIPSCATRHEDHDLTGERIAFALHRLGGKDFQVCQWILRLLCENGFEPFATSMAGGEYSSLKFIHLRQRIEA